MSAIAGADRRLLCNAIESISLGREDLTGLLPGIRVPTLFVIGADHAGFTPEQARVAITLVPGGQCATVAVAAYLAPLEQPGETRVLYRSSGPPRSSKKSALNCRGMVPGMLAERSVAMVGASALE